MHGYLADIDEALSKSLREERLLPVILEFFERPELRQIDELRGIGINVGKVFKTYPLVSGMANPEQIRRLMKLPYVKKIWLNSTFRILKQA